MRRTLLSPRLFATFLSLMILSIPSLLRSPAGIASPGRGDEPATVVPLQSVPIVINEFLADPPTGSAGDANGDGVTNATQDEFVELVNAGSTPLAVGGFTISDATSVRFTFPSGKVIPPGEAAVVFGGGTPTGAFGNASANGLVF
ncbi:MAG TPA: lamin tail domain-containing protein, partial [Blastocatellia bacterium]|nr:lamin tail domain-containing protein [Blastocatellia bacterium]